MRAVEIAPVIAGKIMLKLLSRGAAWHELQHPFTACFHNGPGVATVMKASGLTLTLRQIIRFAAKGYEGSVRSWDHFIDDKGRLRKDADTGDTLVTFIIREIGNTHNQAASADDQLVVARAAIAGAIGNLERVLAALDDADES